jgi:hypothetical protein
MTSNTGLTNQGWALSDLAQHETCILSRYEYRINGLEPTAIALSNLEQHS